MAPPRRTRPLLPPPYERPNWINLNNGQKRYAMEQYNLALVRRGKYFTPPNVSETTRRQETEAPGDNRTPNPINRNADPNSDDEVGGPIQVQADVHRADESIPEQNSSGIDIEDILRPNSTASTLDTDIENDYIEGFNFQETDTPGNFTDLEQQYINDFEMSSPMDVSSSSGAKRSATQAGLGSSHPGSGENNAENQRQQGGDAPAQDPGPIERPFSNRTDIFTRNYKKVHRFFTYGLSYEAIETAHVRGGILTDSFMVTPFCEIPWNRLFMYMNPSEYSLLPPGSRVTDLHIKITQRNVRVAFQTNSTANALATLNQNKNAVYADGLLQYSCGQNIQPLTFVANQPMRTASLLPDRGLDIDYNNHVRQFYGVPNAEAGFLTGIPRHQFGKPYILPYYYAELAFTTEPQQSGWSCFQERYKEFNADTTSCSTFLERHYKPKMGLINKPYDAITGGWPRYSGAAGDITVAMAGGIEPNKQKTIHYNGANSVLEASRQMTQVTSSEINAAIDTYFNGYVNTTPPAVPETIPMAITQLIEKDQIFRSGNNTSRAQSQPSLHIGVQPVPAISTEGLSATYDDISFTDVQCYWEVTCTATVISAFPTRKPLAFVPNVEANELIWRMQNNAGATYDIHPELSMREGLYITNFNTAT